MKNQERPRFAYAMLSPHVLNLGHAISTSCMRGYTTTCTSWYPAAIDNERRNVTFGRGSYEDQCEFPVHTWINEELAFQAVCMIKHCCDSHGRNNKFVQQLLSCVFIHLIAISVQQNKYWQPPPRTAFFLMHCKNIYMKLKKYIFGPVVYRNL